jgi:hypothetical protein
MKTIRIRSRIVWFVSAIAILLQISPALVARPNAQLPMTQGSRVPGFPLAQHGNSKEQTSWTHRGHLHEMGKHLPSHGGLYRRRSPRRFCRGDSRAASEPTASSQVLPACAKLRPRHSA